MATKLHNFEEVKKHNILEDCWIILHGKVYDVTPFMLEHPGGLEVLLGACGKDATHDFEGLGHSETARKIMTQFYIGEIDASSVPKYRKYDPSTLVDENAGRFSKSVIKILKFLAAFLILGLAFVGQKYTKKE